MNARQNNRQYRPTADLLSNVLPTSHDPQVLAHASAKLGFPARYWIAGYVTHADAGDALAELISSGEIDYRRDDPDIEKKHGLWWVTIEQVAK